MVAVLENMIVFGHIEKEKKDMLHMRGNKDY